MRSQNLNLCRNPIGWLCFTTVISLIVGCQGSLTFPDTPVLEVPIQYVVISAVYAKVFQHSSEESEVLFPVRKGDIAEVLHSEIAQEKWYAIRTPAHSGWVRIQDVHLSVTKEEASLFAHWLLHTTRDSEH